MAQCEPNLGCLWQTGRLARRFTSNISSLKAGIAVLGFVLVYTALDLFVIDISELFILISANYSTLIVLSAFMISEVLMGILPPEAFIIWGLNSINPWLHILFLASVSYITGMFAYVFGRMLYTIPSIQNYLQRKIPGHIVHLRRWGGLFIFIGAVLPLSLVSLASGLIKFKITHYLLWALFRIARFFIFAIVLLKIV